MFLGSDLNKPGLRYTEHKQKAYLGFYLVAMILELCFGDLGGSRVVHAR